MPNISILSSSVRQGRASHRVALFFQKLIAGQGQDKADIIDLNEYNFPLFDERLSHQSNPDPKTLEFADRIKRSDGVIIVTPEYNGGYPASLKNAVDLLYDEWYKKPVVIVTVSAGPFAGTQVITSLLFTLWKIRAWVVPVMFPVPKVEEHYAEDGTATDPAALKRAATVLKELRWAIDAGAATKNVGRSM